MKRTSFTYFSTLCALGLGLSLFSSPSAARDLTLNLNRLSFTTIDDEAGRAQYESGQLLCTADGRQVGNYIAYRRVNTARNTNNTTGGTLNENTAMVTMNLFFAPEDPPQNITVQGSHSSLNGKYIGSVSAASVRFKRIRGQSVFGTALANGATNTINIGDLGGDIRQNPCR